LKKFFWKKIIFEKKFVKKLFFKKNFQKKISEKNCQIFFLPTLVEVERE